MKTAATGLSAAVVDKYGRCPLLMGGTSLMAAALAIMAAADFFRSGESHQGNLTLIGLALFVIGYQVGFGPISWIMVSEVAPLRARGTLVGVATTVNFAGNILAGQLVPVMLGSMRHAAVWLVFLAVTLLSLVFIRYRVPETKGRTLEDIEKLMAPRPASP